ncbi:MAG: CoA transferase [Dehalococcoidia bacterium]|jgi:crotonobetainyl-CoA:carnitine CoA-transferase CaiB-like acyl-CoA transferase|nr:CoA transferase [Dehalococcoidia bacterium]
MATSQPDLPPAPLDGVRVLDLTHYIAGPYATKWLATLGADVVKVERPSSGDPLRAAGPFPPGGEGDREQGGHFLYLNTGKRSVALDLATAEGRDAALHLAAQSDVVIESFAPGRLDAFGLGYERLAEANPALVLTSISNFGQDGPYRDVRASEIVIFGMGGLMSLIGYDDEPPLKFGGYQAMYMGGLSALTATMLALTRAELHGAGSHVDVSIFEGMVSSHFQSMVQYEYTGGVQRRTRAMMVFPCSDGFAGLLVQEHQWQRLIEVLDVPELRDERFATGLQRRENYGELEAILLAWSLPRTKQEIYEAGQNAGLPFSFFATVDDILVSPQYEARDFFAPVEHPVAGTYRYPGSPVRFDGRVPEAGRAPLLGEHTVEVLGAAGLSASAIAAISEGNGS